MQFKQKLTPCLSYIDRAEEAASFYVSLLPDGKVLQTVKTPLNDAVLSVEFELAGTTFVALNAGQNWKFSPAFSLVLACESQDEIDAMWDGLTADGGNEVACGWLQDKFGTSWQIVPSRFRDWLDSGDAAAIQRMFESLWQMKKLDIETLQQAFDGNL
ncbi:VOC family protein [Stieleria sp. ICT_E10.1]|uniref:VOC family protein n=1 Tax=Stieleria sedimenti TaxID=2976331 RepID=UPI0021807351|nr:VOC family protein [Stieleria sedimenti]MCS7469205.1 VOC family protein [Stieleria sedimenti]